MSEEADDSEDSKKRKRTTCGVKYDIIRDRHYDDDRYERGATYNKLLVDGAVEGLQPITQIRNAADAKRRLELGLRRQTMNEYMKDPTRPTWDEYKKAKADRLLFNDGDKKGLAEYRAKLDSERQERLAERRKKKEKESKKDKKKRKHQWDDNPRVSDDDDAADRATAQTDAKVLKPEGDQADACLQFLMTGGDLVSREKARAEVAKTQPVAAAAAVGLAGAQAAAKLIGQKIQIPPNAHPPGFPTAQNPLAGPDLSALLAQGLLPLGFNLPLLNGLPLPTGHSQLLQTPSSSSPLDAYSLASLLHGGFPLNTGAASLLPMMPPQGMPPTSFNPTPPLSSAAAAAMAAPSSLLQLLSTPLNFGQGLPFGLASTTLPSSPNTHLADLRVGILGLGQLGMGQGLSLGGVLGTGLPLGGLSNTGLGLFAGENNACGSVPVQGSIAGGSSTAGWSTHGAIHASRDVAGGATMGGVHVAPQALEAMGLDPGAVADFKAKVAQMRAQMAAANGGVNRP